MSQILIIDTSFETCQIALVRDNKIIAEKRTTSGGAHDRVLAGMVEELFKEQNITAKQLNKIFVTTGPGRFTGLRVGIAFARGLSLVHKIPLIGISTTDAIAHDLKTKHLAARLAVLVGVKRGQSFVQDIAPKTSDILVIEDDQLASELSARGPIVIGGVLSEAAFSLLPLAGVTHENGVTEPSLTAILAVGQAVRAENPVVRPYYAA